MGLESSQLCLEAEQVGTSEHYSNYSCSFLPQLPTYSKGNTGTEPEKISPDCLHCSNSSFTPGPGRGVRRQEKILLEFACGESGADGMAEPRG